MSDHALSVLSLVLYSICLACVSAWGLRSAWKDRRMSLTVCVLGALVAFFLVAREVGRLRGDM
jgi:hypothetical protein